MRYTSKYKIGLLSAVLLFCFISSGCGSRVFFEKVDLRGHVRIENEGRGYCFKVPADWEIRERLEDADVVCMAPIENGFRESIIVRTLPVEDLGDPEEAVIQQLSELGANARVVEPWSGPDRPVVTALEGSQFSKMSLNQMIFVHLRDDGSGVLFVCTTTEERFDERRQFFSELIGEAKYDLNDCTGPGKLPEVFPTPEVTFIP